MTDWNEAAETAEQARIDDFALGRTYCGGLQRGCHHRTGPCSIRHQRCPHTGSIHLLAGELPEGFSRSSAGGKPWS
jgi:hypothetical protein